MANGHWALGADLFVPDDVVVRHETVDHGGPWLALSKPDHPGERVTVFGSAVSARRLADGATAWAEALEALEADEGQDR